MPTLMVGIGIFVLDSDLTEHPMTILQLGERHWASPGSRCDSWSWSQMPTSRWASAFCSRADPIGHCDQSAGCRGRGLWVC